MSRLLYQLSYTATLRARRPTTVLTKERPQTEEPPAVQAIPAYGRVFRAPLRNRTVDLLLTMETLYRLS